MEIILKHLYFARAFTKLLSTIEAIVSVNVSLNGLYWVPLGM